MEPFRQFRNGVTMRHPHLRIGLEAFEHGVVLLHILQVGTTILTSAFWLHVTSEGVCHELGTIADAEDRIFASNLIEIEFECPLFIYGIGRTGEDDTNHIGVISREFIVWHDFAEGVELTHTASDELRGLRTKVKNDDFLHIYK